MSHTVYRNASGLPNSEQVTTARDQATLGRAIQDRFPKLYKYFATRTFNYHGRSIANHNKLLGRVSGVDGIKTGYVRASGFNLVASMRRADRHVVAVVLGGASGRARDARMAQLLESNVMQASVRRTAPKVVETAEARTDASADEETVAAVAPPKATRRTPTAAVPRQVAAEALPSAEEPIRPIVVRTVQVKRAAAPIPSLAPAAQPVQTASVDAVTYRTASETPVPVTAPAYAAVTSSIAAPPPSRPGVLGVLPARQTSPDPVEVDRAEPAPVRVAMAKPAAPPPAPKQNLHRGEWVIQVGAFPGEEQAKERLSKAKHLAKSVLASAEPFTERVVKGDTTLYRARFAGFDRDRAEATCKVLKRNEIACLPIKN